MFTKKVPMNNIFDNKYHPQCHWTNIHGQIFHSNGAYCCSYKKGQVKQKDRGEYFDVVQQEFQRRQINHERTYSIIGATRPSSANVMTII